jgi:hypothetical protein
MNDYQKTIAVNSTAKAAYDAITLDITDWWSDDFSGAAAHQGDQYNIAFGKTQKTFEITEAIPEKQVVWLCLKAYIDMDSLEKKDEWAGTNIIWTIATGTTGITINMLHQGLNNAVECYNVCEPAWDYFMASLQSFLNTGMGTPYRKKEAKLEWESSAEAATK